MDNLLIAKGKMLPDFLSSIDAYAPPFINPVRRQQPLSEFMSSEDNLVSMSGAPVFRYTDGEKEWESPHGEESIEEITAHIEKHIGQVDSVFHELISDTVHIDIHHVKPTKSRPFHTLVTSGMSDLPMAVPEGYDISPYMELMITLPADWKISDEAFKDENWYWPIRELKFLARFPHKYDSWFGWGHTLPNRDPAEPFSDNAKFTGVMLAPSINVPEDFVNLKINDEKEIYFFSLIPLYEEEMNLKLKKGADEIFNRFDKYYISDIVDLNRKNVAKKLFGLF